eukprot:jgi/Mesen1/5326/ME000266S04511
MMVQSPALEADDGSKQEGSVKSAPEGSGSSAGTIRGHGNLVPVEQASISRAGAGSAPGLGAGSVVGLVLSPSQLKQGSRGASIADAPSLALAPPRAQRASLLERGWGHLLAGASTGEDKAGTLGALLEQQALYSPGGSGRGSDGEAELGQQGGGRLRGRHQKRRKEDAAAAAAAAGARGAGAGAGAGYSCKKARTGAGAGEIWQKPTPGSPMPPREEFALSREMVACHCQPQPQPPKSRDTAAGSSNAAAPPPPPPTLVVTFTNHAFLDLALNCVRHLAALGVHGLLVGAMDARALEGLFREGVPAFDMRSAGTPPDDPGWGSPAFYAMGQEKVVLVNVFLALGVELLICDTDVVWLRDPLPYFRRWPQADVITSSDDVSSSASGDGLEDWQAASDWFNIGILYFRPTPAARRFARAWDERLVSAADLWDQDVFNELLRDKLGPSVEEEGDKGEGEGGSGGGGGGGGGLVYAYDGSLKLGILPVTLFAGGHTFFTQRLYRRTGLKPFSVHTTFQYGGTAGKRHRLREAGLFLDPPPYYDPPGGLLAFWLHVSQDVLSGGANTLQAHFRLVNLQLAQVRNAMAVAALLNRTLVMPELWCRLERLFWAGGEQLREDSPPQPYQCPLDHVLEISELTSTAHLGGVPRVRIRESSLLRNPRFPPQVLKDRAVVHLCRPNLTACVGGHSRATSSVNQTVRLPRRLPARQVHLHLSHADACICIIWPLAEALAPLKETRLIEFDDMRDAFGGWDTPEANEVFERQLAQYGGIWCCLQGHRGVMKYHFFMDDDDGDGGEAATRVVTRGASNDPMAFPNHGCTREAACWAASASRPEPERIAFSVLLQAPRPTDDPSLDWWY